MPSPETLDFAKLLADIAGENPAGADPRSDTGPASDYHAVRDVRLANRAAERQQLADASAAAPDWRSVLQRGSALLANKAKDLEVAAFLVEALVRLNGFAGLRDGFRLSRELIERYWDRLYPLPDEDGIETRVAPLVGLNGQDGNGTLISPILCVPLTDGDSRFACYHVRQALELSKVKDEAVRARRVQEGTVSLEQVQQAVSQTSREFFATLMQDLTACSDEFGRLSAMLDEKCGAHAPPSSNIRNALAECREAIEQVAASKLPAAGTPAQLDAAAPANAAPTVSHAAPNIVSEGAIATRDDAFRVIQNVADYFRRHEPHSVISYSLEQVVRWGGLSLPALLSELITDESPRRQLFRQVGIRPKQDSSDEY